MFDYDSNICVPLIRCLFNENPDKHNPIPIVVFAPTNRDSVGIGSKKYYDVLNIIENLKKKKIPFVFDLVEGIPYLDNLNRKKTSDIIIDDVDTKFNKFHNTSIEGACFGAISLTNYSGKDYPFIKTDLRNLEKTLEYYLTNPKQLKEEQKKIVDWRKENYTPEKLLTIYEQIYNNLLTSKSTHCNIEQKISVLENDCFLEFFKSLTDTKIFYWIAKTTLVNILKNQSIENNIQIGTNNTTNKELILEQCSKKNIHSDIEIDISPKQNVKTYLYKGIEINIPKPLTKYIENFTKIPWKKFIKE